jgi:hypothetical protein
MMQCPDCGCIVAARAAWLAVHKPGCPSAPNLDAPPARRAMVSSREEIPHRAGTPLGRTKIKIHSLVGRQSVHGVIDPVARIYQSGGEAANFIYRKSSPPQVTMDNSVWIQLIGGYLEQIDWLEFVAHDTNTCYRIAVTDACQYGKTVDRGIGPRWCMPLPKFTHLDRDGNPIP